MSLQLTQWMSKLKREVTEGVAAPRRVRLQGEGTVFESWEPITGDDSVIGDPGEWAKEAELLINALKPELPKRRVQLSFIAEDINGATLQTLFRTVSGENAAAQDLGTQNGAKALADGLASVAKTMEAVQLVARQMMEFQATQLEKAHLHIGDMHEFFMAIRKAELENEEQQGAVMQIVLEQVKNLGPAAGMLLEHWAAKVAKSPAKAALTSVAAAATEAATAATNGVKVS